jgi:hypothetical protein
MRPWHVHHLVLFEPGDALLRDVRVRGHITPFQHEHKRVLIARVGRLVPAATRQRRGKIEPRWQMPLKWTVPSAHARDDAVEVAVRSRSRIQLVHEVPFALDELEGHTLVLGRGRKVAGELHDRGGARVLIKPRVHTVASEQRAEPLEESLDWKARRRQAHVEGGAARVVDEVRGGPWS